MPNFDYYSTLSISPDASAEEIKRAYRTLAMEHHPDRNPGDVRAEKRFIKVNEAYCVLSNPGKRSRYDQCRRVGNQTGSPHGSGFGYSRDKIFRDFSTSRHATNDPENWMSSSDGVAIKVPFKIDDGLVVQSVTNKRLIAKSRIIGAWHGEFILITEPTVQISDRISTVIDGNIRCSYFNNTGLYSFRSRYRKELINNLVCIEYPRMVEVRQMRRDRRIKVNIEVRFSLPDYVLDTFAGVMTDLSAGGCRLRLKKGISVPDEATAVMTFRLPNEALVSQIKARVVKVSHTKNTATALGLSFSGPPDELSKVANFCEFCMLLELDS
jgi:curved DNA-binding protein CbpA